MIGGGSSQDADLTILYVPRSRHLNKAKIYTRGNMLIPVNRYIKTKSIRPHAKLIDQYDLHNISAATTVRFQSVK